MKTQKKKTALLVSFVVFTLCLVLMWGLTSNWGAVRITRNSSYTSNGHQYSYLSYIPRNASDTSPLPCVIVFHGGSENAQSFSGWQMELVRRGYIVFSLDENGTCYSDTGIVNDKLCVEFTNMVKSLPFVDSEKVVTTGQSMGGMYAIITLENCDIAGCIDVAGTDDSPNLKQPLTFQGGNVAYVFGDADLYVRLDGPAGKKFYSTAFGTDGSPVEADVPFGSVEDGTFKVFHWQKGNGSHPASKWNSSVIAYVCKYAEMFAPTGSTLAPENQLYQLMFAVSLVGVISFFAVLVCLFLAMLEHPFFASIKRPLPENISLTGKRWVLSAIGSMLPTIPLYLLCCYLSGKVFKLTKGYPLLPVARVNQFIPFLLAQAIIDILLFYFLQYKKNKLSLAEYGLCWDGDRKYNLTQLGKTCLLTAIIGGFGLIALDILDSKFGLGFTSWWMTIRPITFERVTHCSLYLVVFFAVFIGSQFGANILRRLKPTGHETRDMIRDIVVNCLIGGTMICVLLLVQNALWNNQIFITLTDKVISTHHLYGYSLTVMVAQGISTVMYRKTGSIWPGVLLLTLLLGYLIPGALPIAIAL